MICFIALIVFAILGIFSARYRTLAAEAFDCVFRRMTLRKCRSGLDIRVKSQIIGNVMRKSPKAASFIAKHFEIMSWTFTILLIASSAYSAYSGYNYIKYGNCNGPGNQGFCVFDPSTYTHEQKCSVPESTAKQNPAAIKKPETKRLPYLGPEDAPVTIIEVGCFQCDYTKKATPILKKILLEYNQNIYGSAGASAYNNSSSKASTARIKYIFKPFPLYQKHNYSKESIEALWCADEQGKYWAYYWQLFSSHEECNYDFFDQCANNVGLDRQKFDTCLYNHQYAARVEQDYQESLAAGVYGTPTFFINDRQAIVGPISYKEFKAIIEEELKKS